MIFYFTGTGNSLDVAKGISKYQEEELISIPAIMKSEESCHYTLKDGEKVGFVFPVYAWGPPAMVLDFISKLHISNYKGQYIYAVGTCGESIGGAIGIIAKQLNKRNMTLNSGFSIKMPNNYMIMGMDVDSVEESRGKLNNLHEKLRYINTAIKDEKDVYQLEKGIFPKLATPIVYPVFMRFGMNTKKFYAEDNCTACGICQRVCNTQTIKVINGKPNWGKECTQCLACINLCPVKAIQYGKGTVKKGRYKNPNVTIEELNI